MSDTDLEARTSYVHPDEIHEDPSNPRFIEPERFDALLHGLEKAPKMLVPRPVIVDAKTSAIIAGNMRHRAVKHAMEHAETYPNLVAFINQHGLPAYIDTFTETERVEWMLRDNNGYGDWVDEALGTLVAEYQQMDNADPALLGFRDDELDRIVKNIGGGIGAGSTGDDPPVEVWGVIVECESEHQQGTLLEQLTADGYEVRALL